MITIKEIKQVASDFFDVSVNELDSRARTNRVTRARMAAWFACAKFTEASMTQIGRGFNNRDHTSVLYGVNRCEATIRREVFRGKETNIEVDLSYRLQILAFLNAVADYIEGKPVTKLTDRVKSVELDLAETCTSQRREIDALRGELSITQHQLSKAEDKIKELGHAAGTTPSHYTRILKENKLLKHELEIARLFKPFANKSENAGAPIRH